MPDEIILAESYGSVLVDAHVPCVRTQFHGFANSTEFQRIMETGLAYFVEHPRPAQPWGWIGDVRHMGAIPQAVQDWLTTDWNPRAYAAGIREVGIVLSENVLGQMATQQYVQSTAARIDHDEINSVYHPSLPAAKKGARAALRR